MNGEALTLAETHSEELPIIIMVPGVSASMSVLQRVIAEIAPTDLPVLILGESGTGKEVVASEIHRLSHRCKGPLFKFSCFSTSFNGLLQNTGDASRNGQDGTLLLDEVSQLDQREQTALLTLLSDGRRASRLTSRVISTNTRDLAEEMFRGNFREDLYFRLNGICLRIPALRQRKEDIPLLFASLLTKYCNLFGRQQPQIKHSTMDLLLQHSWPGNIRELENVARKIVVLGDEDLAVSDLVVTAETRPSATASANGAQPNALSLKQTARDASRQAERKLILESLERTHWNRKRSARELRISYKALLYKLKQLEIEGE